MKKLSEETWRATRAGATVYGKGNEVVAFVENGPKRQERARAIAAVPKLVAALEKIQQMAADDLRVDHGEGTNLYQIEADARAALAEIAPVATGAATGEQEGE